MNKLNNLPTDEDLRFFLQEVAKREKLMNVWEQEIANKSKFDFAQIKQKVQAGNEAAFTPFFQKHYHKLYYSLIGKIKSKEKTEDIVMEAIYKFYDRFIIQDKPIPDDNTSGYLYKIAANLWTDSLKTDLTGELEIYKEPIEVDHVTKAAEVEYKVLMKKALQIVWETLSFKYKNMLVDNIVHNLPGEEMRLKYGYKTVNSLESALSQCKTKLKSRGNDFLNDLLNQ